MLCGGAVQGFVVMSVQYRGAVQGLCNGGSVVDRRKGRDEWNNGCD